MGKSLRVFNYCEICFGPCIFSLPSLPQSRFNRDTFLRYLFLSLASHWWEAEGLVWGREKRKKRKKREKILDCVENKITNTTKLSNKHFFRKFGHFFHQISDKFSPSLTNILFSLCTCYYFTQHAAIVACIIKERFRFYKVLRTVPGAFELTMVISRTITVNEGTNRGLET